MNAPKLPVIEVWLLEPIDRVKGRTWPRYSDGRPLEMTAQEDPCEVIVHLPSGRVISLTAKAAKLDQDKGVVIRVSLLPLMELVPFRTAAAAVKRIAADLRINPGDPLWQTLEEWQKQNPDPDVYSSRVYMAKTKLEKGVLLYLAIKVHSERGWYVVVDLTRPAQGETD